MLRRFDVMKKLACFPVLKEAEDRFTMYKRRDVIHCRVGLMGTQLHITQLSRHRL